MWTLRAATHLITKLVLGFNPDSLETAAVRSWEVAPGAHSVVPRSYFLPGQLERITGWAFIDEHPRRLVEGGYSEHHLPTRAFLLKDALLLDGTLYCGSACAYLQPRAHRRPMFRVERELQRGAVYCTAPGNRYFGSWLLDDCATYPLAAAEGTPVTTGQAIGAHQRVYEQLLGMTPERCPSVLLREAVVFHDVGQNPHKGQRFQALGERLRSGMDVAPHPGVFILRGGTGAPRTLKNEGEIAERLRDRWGFRILSPMEATVPAIIAACAGARCVVGIEGSALVHGLLHLLPGGTLFALQPPNRFGVVLKDVAERDGRNFAFVVGTLVGEDFVVDADEVERTLALLPAFSGPSEG